MVRLAALYRHPLKGFTPERLAEIELAAGGAFPGDRLYALENGPSGFDPAAPAFIPKSRFLVLAKFPALAAVKTAFDPAARILSVSEPAGLAGDYDLERAGDRRRLEEGFDTHLAGELQGPVRLISHPDHRFFDDPAGHVSVINLASVRELGARLGRALDPLRFRANLYLDGLEPWAELSWAAGTKVEVGGAGLVVLRPIVRCLATHADPKTGALDAEVVPALFDGYGHRFCGVYLNVARGGRIAVGDRLEIVS